MPLQDWTQQRRLAIALTLTGASLVTLAMTQAEEQKTWLQSQPEQRHLCPVRCLCMAALSFLEIGMGVLQPPASFFDGIALGLVAHSLI